MQGVVFLWKREWYKKIRYKVEERWLEGKNKTENKGYEMREKNTGEISGVATGGFRGTSAPLDSEKFAKNQEKEGENQENSGKKRKNQKEKAKIRKVLSPSPSWQIGLAMLLEHGCLKRLFINFLTKCHILLHKKLETQCK